MHTALSSRLREMQGAGGSVPGSSWTGSPSLALLLSPGVSQVLKEAVTTPRAHTPLRPHSFASTPQTSSSGSDCVLCQGWPAKAKWSKRISPGEPPQTPPPRGPRVALTHSILFFSIQRGPPCLTPKISYPWGLGLQFLLVVSGFGGLAEGQDPRNIWGVT